MLGASRYFLGRQPSKHTSGADATRHHVALSLTPAQGREEHSMVNTTRKAHSSLWHYLLYRIKTEAYKVVREIYKSLCIHRNVKFINCCIAPSSTFLFPSLSPSVAPQKSHLQHLLRCLPWHRQSTNLESISMSFSSNLSLIWPRITRQNTRRQDPISQ